MHRRYAKQATKDSDWVNPRSVCTLTEIGFERPLAVAALRRTKNDVARAVELLQASSTELRATLPEPQSVDAVQLAALLQLGFKEPAARAALERQKTIWSGQRTYCSRASRARRIYCRQ